MELITVVAYGLNRCIGKDGNLPDWRLSSDMAHFKELTKGGAVLMGRKTYESFPKKFRPLPNRHNLILTRDQNYVPDPTNEQTYVCHSYDEAFSKVRNLGLEKVYIIGGAEIYKYVLQNYVVDQIIATEVRESFEGDKFFPILDRDEWDVDPEKIQYFEKDDKNSHSFEIVHYQNMYHVK